MGAAPLFNQPVMACDRRISDTDAMSIRSTSAGKPDAARSPAVLQLGVAEYGLIALQSALWGSAFFFVALAANGLPPITMATARLVSAAATVGLVMWALRLQLPRDPSIWMRFSILGAFNTLLPFILVIIAQREVTGGAAAVLNATAPLFGVVLAPLLIREESFTWRRLTGVLIGIAGVAVMTGAGSAALSGSSTSRMLILAAALLYALANIYARRALADTEPVVIASGQIFAGLGLGIIFSLAIEAPWLLPLPSTTTILAVAAMGVLGSALAALCNFTIVKRAGAMNAMLVTIVLPVTPVLLGAVFLGERLTVQEIVGAGIIAAALLVIDGRILRSSADDA